MNIRQYQGAETHFNTPQMSALDQRGDVLCYNASGGDIPPYAAMKLNGSFTSGARNIITPDEDSLDPSVILFNGAATIPASSEFLAVSDYEVLAKLSGSPDVGDDLGTESGQWHLKASNAGFKARGVTSGGLAYATPFRGGITPIALTTSPTSSVVSSAGSGTYNSSWVDINPTLKSGTYSFVGATPDVDLVSLINTNEDRSPRYSYSIEFEYDNDPLDTKIISFSRVNIDVDNAVNTDKLANRCRLANSFAFDIGKTEITRLRFVVDVASGNTTAGTSTLYTNGVVFFKTE